MIGGLQGDFGDLDNKYLKMSVRNIRKLQEKFRCTVQKWLSGESKLVVADALQVSAIRRSGHVWQGKLKRLPLLSGCEISGCEMSANGIPDVKYPEKVECWPDWIPPRVEWAMRASLSGATPSGFPQEDTRRHAIRTPSGRSTWHSWTSYFER